MIEQNIIEWIDLGDSVQYIDVYTKKKLVKYFSFFRLLIKKSRFPLLYYLIFNFILFFQIIILSLEYVSMKNDLLIEIIKYLSNVLTPHIVITTKVAYFSKLLAIISIVIVIDIILLIYIYRKKEKLKIYFIVYVFNILNDIIYYYLFCPAVHIYLLTLDFKKIFTTVIFLIMIILYLMIVFPYALYIHEIGTMNSSLVLCRIKCNYELYFTISRLIIIIFDFILKYHFYSNKIFKIVYELFMFINCLGFSIYVYQYIFYYDQTLNEFIHFCFYILTWFCFCVLLKTLLNINNITYFTIIGSIIIIISFSKTHKYKRYKILTEVNIFELTSAKYIEVFNNTLLRIYESGNFKSNILIYGVIKRFTDFIKANPELNEQYIRLVENKYLLNKFKKENQLRVLSIIYIIYSYYLEKSSNKEEVGYNFCYFLVNKFKNISFAISIISKLKVNNHKGLFYKYFLMENIKDYLIKKLEKKKFKEPIKHIQMGSVILYNLYIELFKMDIYDAACNQVDYFDTLKNNVTTNKTARNFLKTGNDILKLRKEILSLWHKITELNPFSDEVEKDFLIYLETIIQDEILAKEEIKKYEELKNNKLPEKNTINSNIFIQESSTILLIDGYSSNGRILYATSNFPALFMFSGKEILNTLLEDLLPNSVQPFHKHLIDDSLKFSNLKNIFYKPKDVLIKGKNGGLFNILLFVKPVPNLSYGLIYFCHIQKISDNNFIIILDKDLKINGFTETAKVGIPFTMNNNNNYDLSQNLYGHHIGLIIPEILTQINHTNNSFNISKTDIDLKGSFYPTNNIKELEPKVETIIESIAVLNNNNLKQNQNDDLQIFSDEYNNLINKLQNISGKPISIFYKVELYEYLYGKYKYYRVYITNDLAIENDIVNNNKNKKKLTAIKTGASKMSNENKQIKVKVSLKIDEKNDFLNNQENEEENKNDLNNVEKNNQNNENENNEKISNNNENENINQNNENKLPKKTNIKDNLQSSSLKLSTHLSINSAGFNKIKNDIINSKEIILVKIMKYLYCIFVLSTIYCMAYNDFQNKGNFRRLINYSHYNLYFNHSKISAGNLYIISLNFKWLKDGYKNNSDCLDQYCIIDFMVGIMSCIRDLKESADEFPEFDAELTEIIQAKINISLDIYKANYTNNYYVHTSTIQTILINYGIKLLSLINKYNDDPENFLKNKKYDIILRNAVRMPYYFYYSNISGLIGDKKIQKINRDLFSFPKYFVGNSIVVSFLIIVYIYFILRMFNLEIYFLDKLIAFSSPNFENYLKKLDEIKKKFRNDNNEDEEKTGEELDEMGSKNNSKKEDEDVINEKKSKEGSIKNDNKNKERRKKRGKKQNKIQQQRMNKKKIMSRFFLNANIILGSKIIIVLILTFVYYLITLVIKKNYKKSYLEFDEVNNSIEGIFKETLDVYLSYKTEVAKYENAYKKCNECNNSYEIKIPNNYVTTSQIGNLILPLTKSKAYNKKTVEKLTSLYNDNACKILEENNEEGYNLCANFLSGILLKGMEQSITQLGIIINSARDELEELKKGTRDLRNLLKNSFFAQFEDFVGHFMMVTYFKTAEIYNELRQQKLAYILSMFNTIFFICFTIIVILFVILIYFINNSNVIFNSFFNFIAILPNKYINEDEDLFKEITKLEERFY